MADQQGCDHCIKRCSLQCVLRNVKAGAGAGGEGGGHCHQRLTAPAPHVCHLQVGGGCVGGNCEGWACPNLACCRNANASLVPGGLTGRPFL